MKLLKKLYKIYSPSGYENKMSDFIKSELDKINIKYKTDGNIIYSIKKDTVLLSAHIDQVSDYPINRVRVKKDIVFGDGNLGADDKNGIWVILNLLKTNPHVSFIFSDQEEIGGNISDLLYKYQDILKSIKYGLVFDRRNGSDIICYKNEYGTKKFEKALYKTGKLFGYNPTYGVWSDADELSKYISCCNLSCGYYKAHTPHEYTNFKELNNCLEYSRAILNNITKRYQKPKKYVYDNKYDKFDDITIDDSQYYFCQLCDDYFLADEISLDRTCPYCNSKLFKFETADDNIDII